MSDRAFVNAELLRSVSGVLGAERLAGLLAIFEARIAGLGDALVAMPSDRAALLASLHQSRGSAVSLGFTGLDRALADIQQRLDSEAAAMSEGPALGGLAEAMRAAWQASLAAAIVQSPELRHHRPFGSSR